MKKTLVWALVLCLMSVSTFAAAPRTSAEHTYYVRLNSDPFQAPYYIFSGEPNGASVTVDLYKGDSYVFVRTDSGHPFNVGSGWRVGNESLTISSESTTNLVSGVGSIQAGEFNQSMTVQIPWGFSGSEVSYYCYTHSGMVGTLAVLEYPPGDSDGDGWNDREEVDLGTDRYDADDFPDPGLNWGLFGPVFALANSGALADSTAPSITLNGSNPQSVELNSTYVDPGATANDDVDGDVTANITVSGSVDTSTIGVYTLTYTVSDSSGNTSSKTRAINVIDPSSSEDTTAPVITLNGSNPQSVELNSTYVDPGATATDDVDGDVTANISVSGSVDTSTAGTYALSYTVSDSSGNTSSKTRTVKVLDPASSLDTTAPVITLNGSSPQSVELNSTYTDPGATATDDVDGDVSANIAVSGSVDTSTLGVYTLTYTVSDSSGNSASETRTVNVVNLSSVDSKLSALTYIVDNIVIPNYDALASEAASFADDSGPLATYGASLTQNSSPGYTYKIDTDLAAARNAWKTLMKKVQASDLHIVGPAARNKQDLRNRIHGYYLGGPSLNDYNEFSSCGTDVLVVRANDGSRGVSDANINSRGMVALEYLLFNEDLQHSCSSGVSAVSGWNGLSESERQIQRYDLAMKIARDISTNATIIKDDWSSYRAEFLDPGEIGTNFQLMSDALFYFEKYTKSSKLAAVVGQDPLCVETTCPKFIESPYSEISLENIKVNTEQFLYLFDSGLDNLTDQKESGFSVLFKGLISDVINKIDQMQSAADSQSLTQQVAAIDSGDLGGACDNAFANPDSGIDPQICTLAGLMKKVTDKLKIEFVAYLGVSLPESTQGDTD